jgi:hypothetical protein
MLAHFPYTLTHTHTDGRRFKRRNVLVAEEAVALMTIGPRNSFSSSATAVTPTPGRAWQQDRNFAPWSHWSLVRDFTERQHWDPHKKNCSQVARQLAVHLHTDLFVRSGQSRQRSSSYFGLIGRTSRLTCCGPQESADNFDYSGRSVWMDRQRCVMSAARVYPANQSTK